MHPLAQVEFFYAEINGPLVDAIPTDAGNAASPHEEVAMPRLGEADVMRSGDPSDQVVFSYQRVNGKHATYKT